jgi:hypothetical protein
LGLQLDAAIVLAVDLLSTPWIDIVRSVHPIEELLRLEDPTPQDNSATLSMVTTQRPVYRLEHLRYQDDVVG